LYVLIRETLVCFNESNFTVYEFITEAVTNKLLW